MNARRKKLGDLLVDNGLITPGQLQETLKLQKGTGKRLGEVLIEQGLVTERQILETLEFQLGIPHIYLGQQQLTREIVQSISEDLIRRHKIFPYKVEANSIYLAMADPLDFMAIDDVALATGKDVKPAIATEADIEAAIGRYFGFSQEVAAAIDDLETEADYLDKLAFDIDNLGAEDDAPVIAAVNGIINQAVNTGASDIHIESIEDSVKVRFRIDGLLQESLNLPRKVHPPLISRIKLMANMDIAERRLPQDGRFQIKTGRKKVDLRVSSLPTIFGEKIVIRILDKEQKLIQINQLGFTTQQLEKIHKLLRFPHGMVLVTGPTGSGKTTTLYAALNHIQTIAKNIVTIEDPVEYVLNGINQVQTNPKAGLTFARGLRSILRQDPDVIMVGEIRDRETAEISVRAATTGHLVFSTLHTNDAASALTRLVDMGVEAFLVASSVIGVVAQRLVRRVCPRCSEQYKPQPNSPEVLFLGKEYKDKDIVLTRGTGCSYCNQTGYKGRISIQEILQVTSDEKNLILHKADAETIEKSAVKNGMISMKEDGIKKALEGITTIQEIMRVTFGGEF
ncbi:MAG: type pilus assembly protein PilB [Clostridia bacterium]|jgi:type IV pilus assembly protein PilB|nr:type pilus assembly protein PilB [Clostridia bacterium]MDN5323716.1 type pilus assembly protein PilB [Clostridia bacterium]